MDPIRFAIDNPVKMSVGVILLIMFGLLSLRVIPVQLTPNVDQPVISITTRWQGTSPEELEENVVREQEDKLKTIAGLDKMTSVCQQGEAQVILEFPVGTDKDVAMREVTEKLRQVPDYPENVDEPVVEASDPQNRDYIAWVIFRTDDPNYDIRHLQKWADDNIKTALERVSGVSEVQVLGGTEPEVQVQVDQLRLAQYGITVSRLAGVLRDRNINASAGDIREGKLNVRLRAVGKYETPDQIEQTVISLPDEPVVRVKDVATVELTYKEPFAIVRSKGNRAMAINVQREVGSNVIAVMEGFKAALAQLNTVTLPAKASELGLDGSLFLEQVYDQTIYINQAIDLVRQNLFVGGALAVTVLLVFLRSIRSTLIIALAIPISVIGTFVAMVAMGRNLNVISLAGLAFAVGMVVDNAIVVLENIDRHIKLGEPAHSAAYRAAKEVWGAVLASTLTTLAVFVPVLTVQEEAGQLFRDIALAICAAVTLSLLVSVLVIPSAANRFLRDHKDRAETGDEGPPPPLPPNPMRDPLTTARAAASGAARSAVGAAGAVVNAIASVTRWLISSWTLRLGIVIVLISVALIGSYLLMPPATYLPTGNRNLVFAALFPPPGYSLEKMEEIGLRVEQKVGPYWRAEPGTEAAEKLPDLSTMHPMTGQPVTLKGQPISNFFFVGLRNGLMFTGAISANDDKVKPIELLLNSAVGNQPGIFGFATQLPLINTGGQGNGIQLEISSQDLDAVSSVAEALFGQLMANPMLQQIRPDPGNFNIPTEEVQVRIDMVRASDVGLTNNDLTLATRMLGDGAIIDEYIYQGDGIDLTIVSDTQNPGDAMYIRDVPLATPVGRIVPLDAVSNIIRSTAPQQINRIEQLRSVTLEINLPDDIPLDQAQQIIRDDIIGPMRESGQIPDTVQTNLAGTAAKLREVKRALLGEWTGFNARSIEALLTSRAFLSLVVVFLLMAALFESWLYPLVIMFSVPMAALGGFLGLNIIHNISAGNLNMPTQQLDVLTMLGFIILVGIVVNNAILIVHQALNFMRGQAETSVGGRVTEKLPPRQAIVESVRSRVRPIFMSTFTSVGGMLPLVLFPGSGSELYRGLGSVVVGGLLLSMVFTLILVPIVLSMVFDLRTAMAKLFGLPIKT